MGELTSEAAALLRAGQTAFRPAASDRERVLQSLGRALGEGALIDGSAGASVGRGAASARFSWGWGKVLGGCSVVAVGAGVAVASHFWAPAASPARTAPPAASSIAVETTLVVAAPAGAAPAGAPPADATESAEPARDVRAAIAPRSRARATARTLSDSLAEEVRLLSRAERQLNEGAGADALETLGEHERRFPRGALSEQRMAARVEALCSLGRVSDARGDWAKLARAYPRSPHLDGARRFCGGDFGSGP